MLEGMSMRKLALLQNSPNKTLKTAIFKFQHFSSSYFPRVILFSESCYLNFIMFRIYLVLIYNIKILLSILGSKLSDHIAWLFSDIWESLDSLKTDQG